MKLIYLESEEEITSVIDRVGSVSDKEITLVIPKGGNLIQSIVNLKLLRKHAEMEGKDVTIVTSDQVGVNLAKRAGLTAQRRVAQGDDEETEEVAEAKPRIRSYKEIEKEGVGIKKPVKTSSGNQKKIKNKKGEVSLLPRHKILIIVLVILILLIAGGVFAYFYLPKAELAIALETETITNDVPIEVSSEVDAPDYEANVIPGEKYEVELSGDIEKEATEEKDIGRKAQGTITIYNTYQTTDRTIVPSRFQTSDGRVFRSIETVTLPGYSDTGDNKEPGTVTVAVEADEPGEEYNIGPSDFTLPALPEELQSQIYAKSSAAMVGGSSKMATVVSEDDLKLAEEELVAELRKEAVAEFSREGYMIIPEGSKVETLEYKPDPAKGEEAEKFKLNLRLKLTFLAFREDDVLKAAEDDIEEVLPDDKYLVGSEETSISYEVVGESIDSGKISLYYHGSKSYARSLDKDFVKQEVAGLDASEISALITGKDSVGSVDVKFWPFWVKTAPSNPERVFVDISLD